MGRVIRIEQTADDKFYIREYVERPAAATYEVKVTGKWPFLKKESIKIPCFVWVRWWDYSQPKVLDFTETERHPFYCAATIDEARAHAKKVLADAIKYPIFHEL